GFAADIPDSKCDGAGAVVEVVVDVASNGTGSNKMCGDLSALKLRRARGHESGLDLTRHLKDPLHALFFLVNALVEASVRDADGDLRGKSGESALVVLVVVVDARVFEVEDADD